MADMHEEPKENEYVDSNTPKDAFEEPPEIVVGEDSREQQVIEEDTSHFNYMLRRAAPLWLTNLDTEDFCKLANTTMKLLEMRRKMMLFRTERDRDKGGKGGGFYGAFTDN